MKKTAIAPMISIVAVLILCLLNYEGIFSFQAHANEYNIWGTVIDKHTKQPIANAIVYYGGSGALRIRTNQEGMYHLNVAWGSVYLGVFMKGYHRAEQRLRLAQDEIREVNFELHQRDTPVEQVTITGTLGIRIVGAGTRSENRYLELYPLNREPILIFDEIGMNNIQMDTVAMELEDIVGKLVTITGFYEMGYIGWEWKEATGIYVEKIEFVQ